MANELARWLRHYAIRQEPMPDTFPFRSWLHLVVAARLDQWAEWYFAHDVDRRTFLLLVAEDINTYWD